MHMKFTSEAIARFYNFVGNPVGNQKCRIWHGYLDKDGYGRIRMDGIRIHAHRVACFLAHGDPPSYSHLACHHCDMPWCVEGGHLFWGTAKDNYDDSVSKNRRATRHIMRKLTPDDVRAIRAAEGTCLEVGKLFGVGAMMVSKIRRRIAWFNISDEVEKYKDVTIARR